MDRTQEFESLVLVEGLISAGVGLGRPFTAHPSARPSPQCATVWAWNTCERCGRSPAPTSRSSPAARRSSGAWRFCQRALRGKDAQRSGWTQGSEAVSGCHWFLGTQKRQPQGGGGRRHRWEARNSEGRPRGPGTSGRGVTCIDDMLAVNMHLYGGQAIQIKLHAP